MVIRPSSLFNMDCLVFSKSGILIFIFAENNYSIYVHAMLIKTPLLRQSFGPRVFLSFFFSFSIYFGLFPWSTEAGCVTQGILASFLLSLSHRRLWTTRFRSIKGPTATHFQYPCLEKPMDRRAWRAIVHRVTKSRI